MFRYPFTQRLLMISTIVVLTALHYLSLCSTIAYDKNNGVLECIGFGNDPIIAYLSSPPIASIEENPESLGEQAVALLVKLINGDIGTKEYKKVIVNCNLKIHGAG